MHDTWVCGLAYISDFWCLPQTSSLQHDVTFSQIIHHIRFLPSASYNELLFVYVIFHVRPVRWLTVFSSSVSTAALTCLTTFLFQTVTQQLPVVHVVARRPAPTTLFHVRGRNLATELSLWPGQSCGTVCQRQFVTRTVYILLNADSNRTF